MRTMGATLGDMLLGKTRGRVLALLYGASDESFFVREIARQTRTSAGSIQRELETLSDFGLIERLPRGRQVFYRANRSHPVFPELHSLIAKTSGIFHLLRGALAPLEPRIKFALVYGSLARGEEDAKSDIDLMIVGDVALDEVLTYLTPAERGVGRSINPTVYSLKEFRSKLKKGNHFLNAVVRGKNEFLIGDPDELGKMG